MLKRILFATMIGAFAVFALVMVNGYCRPPLPCGASSNLTPEGSTVIALINAHRNGLPALAPNADLTRAAQWKAEDMAGGNYIAHDDPGVRSWDTRVRQCGYQGGAIGETLAEGQQSAQEAERAWEESAEHNDILLGPSYREVGVAVANATDGTRYWAADFGGP